MPPCIKRKYWANNNNGTFKNGDWSSKRGWLNVFQTENI